MTLSDIFTPCFDRLLLRPGPVPDLGAGLIRPGTAALTRPRTGSVVKLGPTCDTRFSADQTVMHLPFDGKDMSLDGETLVYLHQSSILGVFDMIEKTFVPLWDNLLVKDDDVPEALTAGLVRPGTAEGPRPQVGTIVSTGDGVLPIYAPGTKVVYGARDGSDMTMAGEVFPEKGYRTIVQMAILARLDGAQDPEDYLGESWKTHLLPCPGQMLVERAASPEMIGRIYKSSRMLAATRAQEAAVIAVDEAVSEFEVGERVFLAGTGSRSIPLGWREDVVLWIARPREIAGRILTEPERPIEVAEHPHLAAQPELARNAVDTSAFEEGDTRAPR